MAPLTVAVEGLSDVGAITRIVQHCGGRVGAIYGRSGKSQLLQKIEGYNAAALHSPWFVVVDLDLDYSCAPEALDHWLPGRGDGMCFPIAVRELEAWLLADPKEAAKFLGVSEAKIPAWPEDLDDPKQELINLARSSRRRAVREGLVPRPNSGATIGPTYASDVSDFGLHQWRPEIAAQNAPSLARCLDRLAKLILSTD